MFQKNFGCVFKCVFNVIVFVVILVMVVSVVYVLLGCDDVGIDGMVDIENIWFGVGMMFVGGFVCIGQLVNVCIVIFVVYCVDNVLNDQYGIFGLILMVFSFGVDVLLGFQNWFVNSFQFNLDMYVYNVL